MALSVGLFAPLIGFLLLMTNRFNRAFTGIIGCAAVFVSFIAFLSFLPAFINPDYPPTDLYLYNWIPFDGIRADLRFRLDHLSLLMTLIITGVGFLIHVYSVGYMEHEEDISRFFACMNLFVFFMLILVLASNALLLFIGWEGVGLVSYLLIGYFYTRPQAAKAATKAFIINRIGDAGLLLGMLLTLYTIGTTDFETINQAQIDPVTLTWITMLFLVGAVGKSAQLPLYTWLPDAMEGPTPVSALIHAATMVTAGVYLIVRLHPIYLEAPITLQVVGIIGASTALFAALCAIGQWDLKRVLAYSTVSQLGLMFLALGAGAFYSAMFHLTTHAFIKATLFLSAGNVLHAMNGSTNMWKMGGLAKKLKKTHWFFLIGVLAMSGIPPLAAFFSKELILEQEYLAGFVFLFYIAVISSVLTGFYLTRAYVLTFLGKPNLDEKLFKNIHEAPKTMIWTVAILSLLSIFGGFIGCSNCELPNFLNDIGLSMAEKKAEATGFEFSFESLSALFAGMLGMVAAFFIYLRYQDKPLAILENSFYVNELYHALFVKPLKAISKGFNAFLEPAFFEGSVDEVSKATLSIAEKLRKVQGGEIRSYAALMVIGTVILCIYLVVG